MTKEKRYKFRTQLLMDKEFILRNPELQYFYNNWYFYQHYKNNQHYDGAFTIQYR